MCSCLHMQWLHSLKCDCGVIACGDMSTCAMRICLHMQWLHSLFYRALLQKRPIILSCMWKNPSTICKQLTSKNLCILNDVDININLLSMMDIHFCAYLIELCLRGFYTYLTLKYAHVFLKYTYVFLRYTYVFFDENNLGHTQPSRNKHGLIHYDWGAVLHLLFWNIRIYLHEKYLGHSQRSRIKHWLIQDESCVFLYFSLFFFIIDLSMAGIFFRICICVQMCDFFFDGKYLN